ncbi:20484_t:CDS:1, partial [Funneliformis geosporum]
MTSGKGIFGKLAFGQSWYNPYTHLNNNLENNLFIDKAALQLSSYSKSRVKAFIWRGFNSTYVGMCSAFIIGPGQG